MDQYSGTPRLKIDEATGIFRSDVTTGDHDRQMFLYYQLLQGCKKARGIDIIVSFLMESGVRMLLETLKEAADRGAEIRILTGNYLGITQPSALYLIKQQLRDHVDLRFYNEKDRSFHPKSYIFHYADYSDIFIGSSNVSRSALTSGIEWNYRFSSVTDPENYEKFYNTFLDLYDRHSIPIDDKVLKDYSKNWHRPAAIKDLERYDEDGQEGKIISVFEPRGAQIEALSALENTRAEGAEKALVTAATGIGKTALAAFDSLPFKRVLFVAHREEILRQAARTFYNIRKSDDYGFFNGEEKCTDRSVIFASVATLGNSRYLKEEYFPRDYFQYLIIDEIHHGVTDQYRRITEYFKPQFMLGLTATPERMDGRSIYELCDYNVAYEIPLQEAINKGMLVPFHYYGIYDDTDYSGIHIVKGRYDEQELTAAYIQNQERYDLIYKNYEKYHSKRALGFCCSRKHAEDMAEAFTKRGVPAAAVYSNADGVYSENRAEAIQKLTKGEIQVIFSVDMFNEGVDIPEVDMVMFLRPTESPVVFLQQLGRGLRLSKNKTYLNVLDFIGNYEKAGNVRYYLTGQRPGSGRAIDTIQPNELPDDCIVDFDFRLIDLFREMDRRQMKLRDRITREYFRIKDELGRRPSRMDLFTYMDDAIYQKAIEHAKENPFRHYLDFCHDLGELSEDEEALWGSIGREFINIIETTNMSKVYKMPVLLAFLDQDHVKMQVTETELLKSWKTFFSTGTNWKDLDSHMAYERYLRLTDAWHIKKILQMPVHFLMESGKGFFTKKDQAALALREDMRTVINLPAFYDHFKDAVEYRAMDYYQRRYHEGR